MFIMILNDGETFTNLEGCKMVWLSDETPDDSLDERVKAAGKGLEYDMTEIAVVRVFESVPERADFYTREETS